MSRMRWILSNFNVVNIALAAVLIVFANNMFLPLLGKSTKFVVPSAKQVAPAPTAEKSAESKSPSPSDYFIIAEQNIFHPDRKIPVEKKEAAPLPKPDFVLYGTLILDDLRVAYMEDRKAPQNAPTRGKKQIPLKPGETLSGFTLKEMDADKVVMVRGEERLTVNLTDPSKSKTRDSSITTSVAQAAAPGQPVPAAQQNTGHAPARPAATAQPQATTAVQQPGPRPLPQAAPTQRPFLRPRNRTSNYNVD